jgi:hypothetical protein
MTKVYTVTGRMELFDRDGGWHYVQVPREVTEELAGLADRGLVAITARLGRSQWSTSLLPMGDGTQFVALNARVRGANSIDVGDEVTLSFQVRPR